MSDFFDHPLTIVGGILLIGAGIIALCVWQTERFANRERELLRSQGYEWVPERPALPGYWYKRGMPPEEGRP